MRGVKGSFHPTTTRKVRNDYEEELRKFYPNKLNFSGCIRDVSFNEILEMIIDELKEYRSLKH